MFLRGVCFPTPTGDLDRLLNVMNIIYTMVGEKCFVMVSLSIVVQGLFTLPCKSKPIQSMFPMC